VGVAEVVFMLHDNRSRNLVVRLACGMRGCGFGRGKPQNLFAYGKPDIFDLAASYAFGLVKNHPFIDATAHWLRRAVVFLELNGYRFTPANGRDVRTLALAAGEMTEAAYAAGLKANSKRA